MYTLCTNFKLTFLVLIQLLVYGKCENNCSEYHSSQMPE